MIIKDKKIWDKVFPKLTELTELVKKGDFEPFDAECMDAAVKFHIPSMLEHQCYDFLVSDRGDLFAINEYLTKEGMSSKYPENSNEFMLINEYLFGIKEIKEDIIEYMKE
ncbi:hypothetical protein HOD61_01700 [archaeon]|jgi:hypothetical protein|nr:hypothetical protein [archaeon]